MAKNTDYGYGATASVADKKKQPMNNGKQIGGLRIAVVNYEFEPINQAKEGETGYSIGAIIDQHISERINNGATISEVSLFFDTMEQQNELKNMYLPTQTKY